MKTKFMHLLLPSLLFSLVLALGVVVQVYADQPICISWEFNGDKMVCKQWADGTLRTPIAATLPAALKTVVGQGTAVPAGATRTPRPTATPLPDGWEQRHMYCVPDNACATGFHHSAWLIDPDGYIQDFHTYCAAGCGKQTPSPVNPKPPQCPPGFTTVGTYCSIEWARSVEVSVPPVPIDYNPFPRGIVNDAMSFSAPPLITQAWACSPAVNNWDPTIWSASDDYRNYIYCLRWRQVANPDPSPDPAPAWLTYVWDERNDPGASTGTNTAVGQHTYQTSSSGKPTNGPGNAPSYQVVIHSYWVLDWKSSWEKRHFYCVPSGNKFDNCGGDEYSSQAVEWLPGSDGGTMDLSAYGQPHFYFDSTLIQHNLSGAAVTDHVLPVAVIEVQGVIK
jgi:hypothetical protein